MSIINEALKKATKGPQGAAVPVRADVPKNLGLSTEKKKTGMNWGPVFVLSVLILITGPIIAPVFSSPFRTMTANTSGWRAPAAGVLSQHPAFPPLAKSTALLTRKAQFGIEESSVMPQRLAAQRPYFALSGVAVSKEDSYCILNDRIVRPGESVQGAKLVSVKPDKVVLEFQGERIVLAV